MSFDRLITAIVEKQNPTVAGLDPKLDFIPEHIKQQAFAEFGQTLEGAAEALYLFNKALIDELWDIVPAVKPQCAYYEMYGWQGMRALQRTIAYAQSKGLFVITDGKRNDIGSTMEAYATAHLGSVKVGDRVYTPFGGDALTVNGYLGSDGIEPLLDLCKNSDKGIFVLVKTSNQSSGELQNLECEGTTIYQLMGGYCEKWGADVSGEFGYSGVGAVVGATYPDQLTELRASLPHTFFLVPGYGAQGGGADDIAGAFDKRGLGAIINSSRAIMCAYKKSGDERNFAKCAREEAQKMKEEIISHIGKITL